MSKDRNNKKGFTLAEVLITLTIIGVVAALTIPSLLSDISDKSYNAKRKGFATRLAQAISQIGTLNVYETDADTSSENFITEALSATYKISNVCGYSNLAACDIPSAISWETNTTKKSLTSLDSLSDLHSSAAVDAFGGLNVRPAGFRTKNGESVMLFYNPKCVPEQQLDSNNSKVFAKEICLILFYDLDGAKKGPSRLGKDVGISIVLYPDTPYLVMSESLNFVPTYALAETKPSYSPTGDDVASRCENYTDGNTIHAKGSFYLPSIEELYAKAMLHWFYPYSNDLWSSTIDGPGADDYAWAFNEGTLTAKLLKRSTSLGAPCAIRSDFTGVR